MKTSPQGGDIQVSSSLGASGPGSAVHGVFNNKDLLSTVRGNQLTIAFKVLGVPWATVTLYYLVWFCTFWPAFPEFLSLVLLPSQDEGHQ